MPTYRGGRHEHGQNHLIDRTVVDQITRLAADTTGPIIEIGAGHGAITGPLVELGRPVTAVDIDRKAAERLRRIDAPRLEVVHADFLHWPIPQGRHVVVGNLPFHLTTAILRRLLHTPGWTRSILLVQWEVARRRAGVGGASMMTAQWWPWVDFELHGRVPRNAFRPAPTVDGGLLCMTRRPEPMLTGAERNGYRQFVHQVFTGRGRGLTAIVARAAGTRDQRQVRAGIQRAGVKPNALPKDLSAEQWVSLYRQMCGGPARSGSRRRSGGPDRKSRS